MTEEPEKQEQPENSNSAQPAEESPSTPEPQEYPSQPPSEYSPPPPPPPFQPAYHEPSRHQKTKNSKIVIAALLVTCLLAGSFVGYAATYWTLDGRISDLQEQLQYYQSNSAQNNGGGDVVVNPVSTLNDSASLASLYQNIKASVVVVQDLVPQYNLFGRLAGYSLQQGSGFVTSVNGKQVIVTNNHVIETSVNITVTFSNGASYPAEVLGSDPNADLAVLNVESMPNGVQSLTIISSSTLNVGDTVVAVGSPYGLSGTLTTGIISALGRTIVEGDSSTGVAIPDTIQTSTAINPGNSGGPLINLQGQVVGITTAAVSDSQGLGFAIPSDTILREITALVNNGEYTQHPSLGAQGTDMNLQIAQAMGTDVTYGWLVETASSQSGLEGGTSQTTILGSRVIIGGDIIIGAGSTTITNTDDLLAYLERNTLPGQSVDFTVIRDGQQQTVTAQINQLTN